MPPAFNLSQDQTLQFVVHRRHLKRDVITSNDRLTVAGLSSLQTLLSSDEKVPGLIGTSTDGK